MRVFQIYYYRVSGEFCCLKCFYQLNCSSHSNTHAPPDLFRAATFFFPGILPLRHLFYLITTVDSKLHRWMLWFCWFVAGPFCQFFDFFTHTDGQIFNLRVFAAGAQIQIVEPPQSLPQHLKRI
eukprot:GEMP01028726.1.p1 GENE.GEMP01028726.1~~GEMP01028726.1.p1  ORF type:complete len:124 (-),score=9.03 GEMP01028726.1:436-807(-)